MYDLLQRILCVLPLLVADLPT